MNIRSASTFLACCLVLAAWPASPAHAQSSYRCIVNGRQVLSDRPCTGGAGTKLSAFGPTQRDYVPGRQGGYTGSVVRAPDHLGYLSPECAQLNDALRTASTRGVGHAVQRDLQLEYQNKCGEDDRYARQQLANAQTAEREGQRKEREARASAKALTQREREQCHEMLRILHGKRQRMGSMTEGEQGDLQRFEANYNARCKG